jgi:hypothetical protein
MRIYNMLLTCITLIFILFISPSCSVQNKDTQPVNPNSFTLAPSLQPTTPKTVSTNSVLSSTVLPSPSAAFLPPSNTPQQVTTTTATGQSSTPTIASTPTNQSPTSGIFIDWVDFIKFNDITYLGKHDVLPLAESQLSPYREIEFKVADNVTDLNYKIKNGDAAFLDPGTPVYSLSGYSPYFRLVAKRNQSLRIYESDSNPKAKTGADLLDIEGKVEYIKISGSMGGTTQQAFFKDQLQVTSLVSMIIKSPVNQSLPVNGPLSYSLEFHLKDGTISVRGYLLDKNTLSRGIQLPTEFSSIIQAALNEQVK